MGWWMLMMGARLAMIFKHTSSEDGQITHKRRCCIASFDDADYLILIDLVPSLEVPNWCLYPKDPECP